MSESMLLETKKRNIYSKDKAASSTCFLRILMSQCVGEAHILASFSSHGKYKGEGSCQVIGYYAWMGFE